MLSKSMLAEIRRTSPITADQRRAMDTVLAWLPRQSTLGVKEAQRVADAYRPPLLTVGRAMITGFIEYGDRLIRLQEKVPHGFWLMLFKDAGLARPIGISSKVAQAYMRIARHPMLSNADVLDQLPPHWRTLQTLTRVSDPVLNQALTRGRIHPHMQRAEAEDLVQASQATWALPASPPAPRARTVSDEDLLAELHRWIQRATQHYDGIGAVVRLLRAEAATLEERDDREENETLEDSDNA